MPSKRDVLAQLQREELISVVERFGLEVADRRKKDDLLEAVASSRKATLADVLPDLSRERLKELCVALGLDDGARISGPPPHVRVGRRGVRGGGLKSRAAPHPSRFARRPLPGAWRGGNGGSKHRG